jgi:hypothetical protein
VWFLDDLVFGQGDGLPLTRLAGYAAGPGQLAGTDGTGLVEVWRPTGSDPVWSMDHGEDVECVDVAGCGAADGDAVAVAAVGDGRASLWVLRPENGSVARTARWDVPEGVARDVLAVPCGRRVVVAASGDDGARVWSVPLDGAGTMPEVAFEAPTSRFVTTGRTDEQVTLAAVAADDVIHRLTVGPDGAVRRERFPVEDGPLLGECLPLTDDDGVVHLATWSQTGTIQVWALGADALEVVRELRLPVCPAAFTVVGRRLAFATIGRVTVWDALGDGGFVTTPLDGKPSHLVAVGSGDAARVLCATTSGAVLVLDPVTGETTTMNTNCEFSQLVGLADRGWAVGAHGGALIALAPGQWSRTRW